MARPNRQNLPSPSARGGNSGRRRSQPMMTIANNQLETKNKMSLAAPARMKQWTALAAGVAGLIVLVVAGFGVMGAWGDPPTAKDSAVDAPARWVLLFRADDPALWNTKSRGEKFAVPLKQ